MPVAHLLPPLAAPAALDWAVSVGLATGLCVLFLGRAAWRWAGAALCLLAGAAGLSLLVVATGATAPGLRLRLMVAGAPAGLTSPVEVHVCADTGAGGAAPLPGSGRLLMVLVDGRPVGTQGSSVFAVELAPGVHRLGVELVTGGHRAFSPAVAVAVTVTVGSGRGPLAPPAACGA